MFTGEQIGEGMVLIQPSDSSITWFEAHSGTIFDWLGIPKDECGLAFREIAGRVVLQGIRGERLILPDGSEGPYVRCDHLSDNVQAALRELRYKRPAGSDRLSVFNLKCYTCHHRVWDFSRRMARGYAGWKSAMMLLEHGIERYYELQMLRQQEESHNWPFIWHESGGQFHGEAGRMIAHVTDGIWVRISQFGVPWDPFRLDSGMGLVGLGMDKTKGLGLTIPASQRQVTTGWWDLNE